MHDFGTAAYDLVVSRTGTMIFGDPAAAFANLATATRPGGRLVILVGRSLAENEWLREILQVVRACRDLPMPPPGAPGPLAESGPTVVEPLLAASRWSDIALDALDEPIWLGGDVEQGVRWQLGQTAALLAGADPSKRDAAARNLRPQFSAHETPDGIQLGSAAWLVTACRPA